MKDKLIIILFHNPWDWSADYANQTAYELCKHNYVVCVLLGDAQSLKEHAVTHKRILWQPIHPRLYTFTPIYILPFRRFKAIERMNSWLNILFIRIWIFFFQSTHAIRKRFVWVFYPGHTELIPFFGTSFLVVYDCIDYFSESTARPDARLVVDEKQLIGLATYFFVNSQALYNRHKEIRKATIVPQGFRIDEFKKPAHAASVFIPHDKPVIGYIGGINYRLDYQLLYSLVKNNTQYYFVFVGPIQTLDAMHFHRTIQPQMRSLFQIKSCLHYPQQPKETMSSIIQQFDICMIPYDTRFGFNKYCYPMKLFEYFYAGKPVVSTPIEELKLFPKFVFIGSTAEKWEKYCKMLLSNKWSEMNMKFQRQLAIQNSWKHKIEVIYRLIE